MILLAALLCNYGRGFCLIDIGTEGGDTRVTSSTIDIGKLVIGLFDPATKQLIWRGSASKTLDIKKDPEKNYRTLEKAMAKLFKNYPPGLGNR
jgi:hypothetical protein